MLVLEVYTRFRTTLGHKVNHLFEGTNTVFDTINHPVHGGIVCLIATEVIDKDDELYVDYLYNVDDEATDLWYKELYEITYGKVGRKKKDTIKLFGSF